MRRNLGVTVTGIVVTAIVAVALALFGVFGVGAATDPVTVKASVSTEGKVTIVDISITNNTSKGVGGFAIEAVMPAGGKLVFAAPSTYQVVGGSVKWEYTKVLGAGKSLVGYQVKIEDAKGEVNVNVKYWGTSTGTAVAKAAIPGSTTPAAAATATPEPPRRGCLACHVVVDKNTGKYSLGYEAEERAKADYNAEHPGVAPSGAKVDPMVNASVASCLECHRPSKDNPGKGVGAPITLRDIVHPAHMFSATFVGRYKGGCFTCHNVRGDGVFELLDESVEVNDKGVPKALQMGKGAIPGSIPPSEGGR